MKMKQKTKINKINLKEKNKKFKKIIKKLEFYKNS